MQSKPRRDISSGRLSWENLKWYCSGESFDVSTYCTPVSTRVVGSGTGMRCVLLQAGFGWGTFQWRRNRRRVPSASRMNQVCGDEITMSSRELWHSDKPSIRTSHIETCRGLVARCGVTSQSHKPDGAQRRQCDIRRVHHKLMTAGWHVGGRKYKTEYR